MGKYSKFIIGLIFTTLFFGSFSGASQMAFADSGKSKDCRLELKSESGTEDLETLSTNSSNIITEICIKSGKDHPNAIISSDGVTADGCYLVTGLGTPDVTVERILSSNSCMGISHVDGNSVPVSAPVCGDGNVDPGETCDARDSISETAQFKESTMA